MEVKQLLDAKFKLKLDIIKLIEKFNEETEVRVVTVYIQKYFDSTFENTGSSYNVSIKLDL